MALAPYRKQAVIVTTASDCDEVRAKLSSSLKRWVLVRQSQPQIVGSMRANRITLRVAPLVPDLRNFEFRGTIVPDERGGTRVAGVFQTSTPYRFFAIPAAILLAAGSVAVVAARVAAGDSVLHPFFFLALAVFFCVGVAMYLLPALQPEELERNSEAILAWLEAAVGGSASMP